MAEKSFEEKVTRQENCVTRKGDRIHEHCVKMVEDRFSCAHTGFQ